jgi:hypothetical protein
MVSQELGFPRPLCPTHRETMVCDPGQDESPSGLETSDFHSCECIVDACSQHYSPEFGYFTVERNDDFFVATNSPSLRILRRDTQAICGQHGNCMFIESFEAGTNWESFRCSRRTCEQTIRIMDGGPPAYWLGSGFWDNPENSEGIRAAGKSEPQTHR